MDEGSKPQGPVILFDGICNLCQASVKWVIRNDPEGVFKMASLQSQAAQAILGERSVAMPDSVVLVDEEGVHTESMAAIRVARRLGRPWWVARLGPLVPRPLRDAVYRFVARNRYRWFGRQDSCMVPTPELRSRFLDADEAVG